MLNTLCAFCLILLCFLSIHLYNKIIQNQYNLNLIEKQKALEKKGLESQEVAESDCNEYVYRKQILKYLDVGKYTENLRLTNC